MLVAPPDDAEQAFRVARIKLTCDGGLARSFHVRAIVEPHSARPGPPSLVAHYKPMRDDLCG